MYSVVVFKNLREGRSFNQKVNVVLCIVLWVTLLIVSSQSVYAQNKPDWLEKYPADPRYYIGVGGINKQNTGVNYQQKAQENALAQLVSQIEVNISSTMELLETESNGQYEDLFTSMVQSQASKTIENFDIVDSWESDTEFWMYIRLSKRDYERRLDEKINIAKRQATAALNDGDKVFAEQRTLEALSFYVQGISDIAAFIDQPMQVTSTEGSIDLFATLRSKIQECLNIYQIVDSKGPTSAQVGKSGDEPFQLSVQFKSSGEAVSDVPVSFYFLRGDGEFTAPVRTNNEGVASGTLSKVVAPDAMQIIQGRIALEAFSSSPNDPYLVQLFSGLNAPTARYVLRVQGVPVFIESSHSTNHTTSFDAILKEELNESGYSFIDDLASAEFYLEVNTEIENGSESYGIYSSYLSYEITVTNMLTGASIATYSRSRIKGMRDSYDRAAEKAVEEGVKQLREEVIPDLIALIQQ